MTSLSCRKTSPYGESHRRRQWHLRQAHRSDLPTRSVDDAGWSAGSRIEVALSTGASADVVGSMKSNNNTVLAAAKRLRVCACS